MQCSASGRNCCTSYTQAPTLTIIMQSLVNRKYTRNITYGGYERNYVYFWYYIGKPFGMQHFYAFKKFFFFFKKMLALFVNLYYNQFCT